MFILICLYGFIISLIIGVAILILKMLGYALIGLFLASIWIIEKLVKALFRPWAKR